MKIESNIVVYNQFKIIEKHKHWSLAKYTTIYGVNKIAIILNDVNIIINSIENSYQISMKLKKYDEVFRNEKMEDAFKSISTITLIGEYKINDKEYIVNYPYIINYGLSKISIVPLAFKKSDKVIVNNPEERMHIFYHKLVKRGNETYILYEMDINGELIRNLHKGKKTAMSKQYLYYKETYEVIIQSYNNHKLKQKREKQVLSKIEGELIQEELTERQLMEVTNSNDYEDVHNIVLINESNDEIVNVEPKMKLREDEIRNSIVNEIISNRVNRTKSIQDNSINSKGNLEPEKILRSVVVTNRNSSIVKYLKNEYADQCQICGETIEISPGNFLSEVHHIKPLGEHNGADVMSNMIVLCPNHHSMFDRGAITIDIDKKVVIHFNPANPLNNKQIELKHEINASYIAFHNMNIFITSTQHKSNLEMASGMDTTIQTVDFGNIVTLQDMDTSELFEVRLEDKFNKDFMKPIEKVILQKCLNNIVRYDAFRYKIIKILTQ